MRTRAEQTAVTLIGGFPTTGKDTVAGGTSFVTAVALLERHMLIGSLANAGLALAGENTHGYNSSAFLAPFNPAGYEAVERKVNVSTNREKDWVL